MFSELAFSESPFSSFSSFYEVYVNGDSILFSESISMTPLFDLSLSSGSVFILSIDQIATFVLDT